MAGPAGFEPANAGTKTQCLTAWRRSNAHYSTIAAGNRQKTKTEQIKKQPDQKAQQSSASPKIPNQNPATPSYPLCFFSIRATINAWLRESAKLKNVEPKKPLSRTSSLAAFGARFPLS